MSDELEGKHGVQSLEVGMGILKAMVGGKRSMMLKDIAAAAEMPPSKAHRYLVSLIRAGLVEQDPLTSRYNLGPFALNIGLVAIDRLDRVRVGMAAIAELRDQINETTALAVWGDSGPVVVRWERPRRAITVNVVTGTRLSLLSSAAGRVFAAWLPRAQIDPLLLQELANEKKAPPGVRTLEDAHTLLAEVEARGVAAITGNYMVKGVEALAAPVFNFKNELTMALIIVGVEGSVDMGPDSSVIAELKRAAESLSRRLGSTRNGEAPPAD
ncbi:MAG: IclR family transcriptional regulator [Zoogloea sp.]|nr:IclR family transcriptional regulator [Zoogloea sp.]